MGLLDTVLSTLAGQPSVQDSALIQATIRLLGDDAPGGGLRSWVARFERGGAGHVMQSWIGHGRNLAIEAEQLGALVGHDTIDALAKTVERSPTETLSQLAKLLPCIVNRLTPAGVLPDEGLGEMDELVSRFLENY